MVKGFKDSTGKFHPITDYKGVRKSRVTNEKTKGVKIRKLRFYQSRKDILSTGFTPEQTMRLNEKIPFRIEKDKRFGNKITTRSDNFGNALQRLDKLDGDRIIDLRTGETLTKEDIIKQKEERKARIFQDDPDAVSKLEVKLARLEKEKAYWKGLKPLPRTYQANEPDGAKRSFMLPNLNANIRTVRQKIELIKSRQEKNIGLERKTTFKNGRKVFYYEEVERKKRVLDEWEEEIIKNPVRVRATKRIWDNARPDQRRFFATMSQPQHRKDPYDPRMYFKKWNQLNDFEKADVMHIEGTDTDEWDEQ